MLSGLSLAAAIFMFAAAPAAATPASVDGTDRAPPEKSPSAMTGQEISGYNKGLAATHPYYIRCRKIKETGSLVKKARVCKTNEGWKQAFAVGNQDARDTADAMSSKFTNSN